MTPVVMGGEQLMLVARNAKLMLGWYREAVQAVGGEDDEPQVQWSMPDEGTVRIDMVSGELGGELVLRYELDANADAPGTSLQLREVFRITDGQPVPR